MASASKSLASQFNEFRTAFFAAGGQRKGLRYPDRLRRAAVSYLRSMPGQDYRTVAGELGVGGPALKFWDSKMARARLAPEAPRATFLPLEVVAPKPAAPPLGTARGHSTCMVTCREISIELGASVDEVTVQAILAALQNSKGGVTP